MCINVQQLRLSQSANKTDVKPGLNINFENKGLYFDQKFEVLRNGMNSNVILTNSGIEQLVAIKRLEKDLTVERDAFFVS